MLAWDAERIVLGGSAVGPIPVRVEVSARVQGELHRHLATVVRGLATGKGLYLELRPDLASMAPTLDRLQKDWSGRASAGRLRQALDPTTRDLLRDVFET